MGFKKIYSKIISAVVLPALNPAALEKLLDEYKIQKCFKEVIAAAGTKFYEKAAVHNYSGNRSNIKIGGDTHIRGELLLFANGGKIEIGHNCYIGESTRIWSAESVFIGNDVLISHNCNIIDTNSHELDYNERSDSFKKMVKQGHPSYPVNIDTAPIVIEDNAWLSYNVSVLKGVRIGKGAIVAAGSVVTKDVPAFSVAAGNPAVIIKTLTP